MLRQLRRQIIMLIGEDIPAAQQVMLRTTWHIRHVDQRPELLHQQIALLLVAALALSLPRVVHYFTDSPITTMAGLST